MKWYNLWFISDIDIYSHVKETVEKYRFKIDLKKFNANLVDPIKLTFDAKIYWKSIEEVIESEIIRQIDKSNTNHIWYFHQNIFRFLSKDWEVPKHWYDVINKKSKIFVEMKNKHNTMNSSSSQKTYMKMQNTILNDSNSCCYLVEVIAKNSQDIPWKVSLDWESVINDKIRRISIDKFYEIVTGDSSSFKKLCEKLPFIIDDVIEWMEFNPIENTVIEELRELSPNIMKSIFLLSFSSYEWFSKFELN